MELFQNTIQHVPEFIQLCSAMESGVTPCAVTGLSAIHKAHFIAGLHTALAAPVLVITDDEATAGKLCEDINMMLAADTAMLYPAKDINLTPVETASREYEHQRLAVLSRLISGDCKIAVACVEAALQHTVSRTVLATRSISLKTGQQIDQRALMAALLAAGYTRSEQVDGASQFASRGAILDIYPVQSGNPVRIELWGDEIDSIHTFDTDTQRRVNALSEIHLSPASEVLFDTPEELIQRIRALLPGPRSKSKTADAVRATLQGDIDRLEAGLSLPDIDKYLPLAYEHAATILDYFDSRAVTVLCEFANVREKAKGVLWQHAEDIKLLFEDGRLCKGLDSYLLEFSALHAKFEQGNAVYLDLFARTSADIRVKRLLHVNAFQTSPWGGELKALAEDLASLCDRGYSCGVLAGTEKAARTLADDLRSMGLAADYTESPKRLLAKKVQVTAGTLTAGYDYPEAKAALITHVKAVPSARKQKHRKRGEEIRSLSDISVGDLVVHVSHGIGCFEGIHKLDLQGVVKDYIKIRYAGTDILYVPVTQLDLVSKYIGPKEDSGVKLNKMGGAEWNKTRARVRGAVKEMAAELIALYAKRLASKGFAFSPDNDWQHQFEDHFDYQETDDQLRSVEEIKEDMQKPMPMDRLLCGDVGFGKTEVALRAAFKCVLDSKQCAILVPTTVLAWQHYQTITKRMEPFPVKVELLSRFRNPKQQKEILKQLASGEVDIVVGTHRLVQKDIAFKDLGLVVIDEEQRFGVAHKERFKEAFTGVDVLTLSATPIPRTLNMAMSGIRDMSVIEEPPQDRHPVQTYVIEHDWGIIAQAIAKELRRAGQVYYIHNRIESIEQCASRLAGLLPQARIATAHGQMGEEALSEVWRKLVEREIDVLVCTTIIETGVDVQNCNTLVIEDADNMGLSQLYQLRGRVGRSNRRAFAYFTFKRGKVLTEIAAKRLDAIREFTQFGSGFRIALRDLEIRGAGSILGARQHGHMEAVGYDMYLRLLSDAIAEQQGKPTSAAEPECLVDVRVDAHIPERYIESLSQRIDVYRKIASIKSDADSLDVIDELIDRYGEPPKAVTGLVDVALLRNTAAGFGISEISQRNDSLLFYVAKPDMQQIAKLSGLLKGRVMFSSVQRPYISVRILKGNTAVETMKEVLGALGK